MSSQNLLKCSNCQRFVGVKDPNDGTFRLFKWNIKVQLSDDPTWEEYSVQEIVSAQLLALIEEQATYRFVVYSGNVEEVQEALLVSQPCPSEKASIVDG